MIIDSLKLYTSKLNLQRDFYTEILGFDLLESGTSSFSVQTGYTCLEFEQSPSGAYYHFAFNIPSNKIFEAYNWLRPKTEILAYNGKDIVDFPNWNAQSLYFYDAGGNILEFIARKNLKIFSKHSFSISSILGISEIGLPVNDVQSAFKHLNMELGIEKYWGDFDLFCAAGDEEGLFIIVDQARKKWFPTSVVAEAFPLSSACRQRQRSYNFFFDKFEIHSKKS